MRGGRFLPRKEKPPTAPAATPPPKEPKGKLSQVAAFRALLEISPGTMQRVASSPNFLAHTQNPREKSGSESRLASESRAGSQEEGDWMQDRDLMQFLNELEGNDGSLSSSSPVNEIVEDIVNDLVQKMLDAKSKKIGTSILTLSNTLSQHDIFKRIITDDIPFRLESTLDTLLDALNRSRGSKSVSTIKDGLAALKLIIFLFVTLRPSRIEESVSGSMLESLTETILQIVTPPKRNLASNPHLTFLSWLLLGIMLRNGLAHDMVQDYPPRTWTDLLSDSAAQLITRKNNQRESKVKNEQDAKSVTWSPAEILDLDGLCLCISLYQTNYPKAGFRDRDSGPLSFVWRLLFGLADTSSGLDFINAYANSLGNDIIKTRGANHLLGLPHLVGIAYEAYWSFFNERDREQSSPLDERDNRLLTFLEGFDGRLENASVKAMTKSLTKEMTTIFRDAACTLLEDTPPRPCTLQIQRNDVFDTLAAHAPQFESEEALSFVGASISAQTWEHLLMLRCCKTAGGNHSTLALAIEAERSGMLVGRGETPEAKNERAFRQQSTRRSAQQSRKNDRSRKQLWHQQNDV